MGIHPYCATDMSVMQSLKIHLLVVPTLLFAGLFSCKGPETHLQSNIKFTKVDSLTERYLNLEDSILYAWNTLINEDNHKIRLMHDLVHQLLESKAFEEDQEKLIILENQLNMLSGMNLTPESIRDSGLVHSYDSASHTIVMELMHITEPYDRYADDRKVQKIVSAIREANLRSDINRSNYDLVAGQFNTFIERNKDYLSDKDQNLTVEKRPLFQMTASQP